MGVRVRGVRRLFHRRCSGVFLISEVVLKSRRATESIIDSVFTSVLDKGLQVPPGDARNCFIILAQGQYLGSLEGVALRRGIGTNLGISRAMSVIRSRGQVVRRVSRRVDGTSRVLHFVSQRLALRAHQMIGVRCYRGLACHSVSRRLNVDRTTICGRLTRNVGQVGRRFGPGGGKWIGADGQRS